MKESVQDFIMTIKERNHVLQLIRNIDFLQIRLVSETMSMSFAVSKGELFSVQNENEELNICEISGEKKDIKDLLEGKERLRSLLNNGLLKISAPFRTILLLESIFYLTKAKDELIKTV